jgi:AraC-like DNA-binding protein
MGVSSDAARRETTRDRVKAFIYTNLQDPMLSLDRVAAAVGCSKRNLHKMFALEDETLNTHIWNCRLDRIRHDLANPALLQQSITEIAFAWGFNSSTHFSRSFRERYGVAPRAYRTMVHRDGAYWAVANKTPV